MKIIITSNRYKRLIPEEQIIAIWGYTALYTCKKDTEVAINITGFGPQAIRKLNNLYRGLDKATNVLSFEAGCVIDQEKKLVLLGDIALCPQIIKKEARAEKKPYIHHCCHLLVHAILHLIGYDHQNDEQADKMQIKERQILSSLGMLEPYL